MLLPILHDRKYISGKHHLRKLTLRFLHMRSYNCGYTDTDISFASFHKRPDICGHRTCVHLLADQHFRIQYFPGKFKNAGIFRLDKRARKCRYARVIPQSADPQMSVRKCCFRKCHIRKREARSVLRKCCFRKCCFPQTWYPQT